MKTLETIFNTLSFYFISFHFVSHYFHIVSIFTFTMFSYCFIYFHFIMKTFSIYFHTFSLHYETIFIPFSWYFHIVFNTTLHSIVYKPILGRFETRFKFREQYHSKKFFMDCTTFCIFAIDKCFHLWYVRVHVPII